MKSGYKIIPDRELGSDSEPAGCTLEYRLIVFVIGVKKGKKNIEMPLSF